MRSFSKSSSPFKYGISLCFVLFMASGLRAQDVTIYNSNTCDWNVTLKAVDGSCSSCAAAEITLIATPGTTTHTMTGCLGVSPVYAEIYQDGCTVGPPVALATPNCACSMGASTASGSLTIPASSGCCEPGTTATFYSICSSSGPGSDLTIYIN